MINGKWLSAVSLALAGGMIAVFVPLAGASELDSHPIAFNVPAQSLDTALVAYAEQAQVQLIVAADALKGHRAREVTGLYDASTALRNLLAQSGLYFEVTAPNTVTVRKRGRDNLKQ